MFVYYVNTRLTAYYYFQIEVNLSNIYFFKKMNKCATRGLVLLRSHFYLPARLCSSDLKNIASYNPDIIDKKILVHFKYYDKIEDVPSKVDQHMMGRVSFIAIYWNNKQKVCLKSKSLLVFLFFDNLS